MCLGFLPLGYGLAWANPWLAIAGTVWLTVTYFAWINEPVTEGDDDDPPRSVPATDIVQARPPTGTDQERSGSP